ncbi:ABC transporter ATP-binding protein [Pleomorphomonas sp. NRK KF1]|uniref:ABC transporter ATP-binding protein n=1 Tax=Pleomorphomonas sp. NRK KF1 TaxID=2943000 RepID=UPI00204498AB|nr:ABC transporter ATP-binding protein [Pleomorphomonas sp. NRK KF1]MCM5552972.1 ABC transporter ATP-binding protein [Pleomorphomonas sp. NRK KF1]
MTHSTPILAVHDLAWAARGVSILDGIGFSLSRGGRLVIVGRNGAGKSSLLRCLYRVNRPTAGRVLLDGADIWQMSGRAFACKVATVLQEMPVDFGLTAREIVELGRLPHRRSAFASEAADGEIVGGTMARLDVDHLAHRAFATLSGGEKQRVMLARALVQEPDLLILDEPTNHLDIRHRLELVELLRALPITIIATMHDLDLAAAFGDEMLVLSAGRLAAHLRPDALTPELIRAAFDVEAEISAVGDVPRFSFALPAKAIHSLSGEPPC